MVNIYIKTRNVVYYSLFSLILGCNTELNLPDNIPPNTKILSPRNNEIFNTDSVKAEWDGNDLDGRVIGFLYKLDNTVNIYPNPENRTIINDFTVKKEEIFRNLINGYYRFEVKAQDDQGAVDPSPNIIYFFIDVKE